MIILFTLIFIADEYASIEINELLFCGKMPGFSFKLAATLLYLAQLRAISHLLQKFECRFYSLLSLNYCISQILRKRQNSWI